LAGILAVLFPLVVLVAGCKNDLDRVRAIEVPADGPDRITTDAEYLYSDSGVVRNRVRAGTVEEYDGEKPYTLLSNGVELTFYNADGEAGSRLTARRGRIDPKANRMQVEEKVVFVNAEGEKLETEQLTWSQDSGRVSTDRPVKITRAHDVIYGQGLDAAQDFSRYTVRKITGTLFVDRSDTLAPTKPTP
jgi:LPS export ABC transporter protein LptC